MFKKITETISLLLAAVILSGLFLVGCSGGQSYQWPKSGLASLIEKPNTNQGKIISNEDTMFSMDAYECEEADYNSYIDSCKKRGFTIDENYNNLPFKAFNKKGYELSVTYLSSLKKMTVTLEKPMEMGKIKWPETGLAKLLPIPKSDKGKIIDDNSGSFYAHIADTNKDSFSNYIDECIKLGFKKDYSKSDNSYNAKDGKNHKIEIMYEGFNRMSVYITSEKKGKNSETKSEVNKDTKTTPAEKSSVLKVEPADKQKLEKLVGKTVYKAKKTVKSLKYKVKYYYDSPKLKQDYTNYVGYTSKKDLKLMFVTKVENINANKRTADIYINDKNPSKKAKKKNSLSWETVCSTVELYGKNKYPGFSLNYFTGLIANQEYDDGSYMIKANCTIKNAYGIKQKSVCEAKVAGTDKNPKVTYFFVYD